MKIRCRISGIIESLRGVANDKEESSGVRVEACAVILRAIEVFCELSHGDLDKEV